MFSWLEGTTRQEQSHRSVVFINLCVVPDSTSLTVIWLLPRVQPKVRIIACMDILYRSVWLLNVVCCDRRPYILCPRRYVLRFRLFTLEFSFTTISCRPLAFYPFNRPNQSHWPFPRFVFPARSLLMQANHSLTEIPHEGPMADLVWSDPDAEKEDFAISPRFVTLIFEPSQIHLDLKLIRQWCGIHIRFRRCSQIPWDKWDEAYLASASALYGGIC